MDSRWYRFGVPSVRRGDRFAVSAPNARDQRAECAFDHAAIPVGAACRWRTGWTTNRTAGARSALFPAIKGQSDLTPHAKARSLPSPLQLRTQSADTTIFRMDTHLPKLLI